MDPDLQASFAAALAEVFKKFRDNWKKIYEELEKSRERIINARKEPTYGLHRKKQMPLFRMFKREIFGEGGVNPQEKVAEKSPPYGMTEEDRISLLVDLTQKTFLVVERELGLTGFWESIPARNKLRAELQNILLSQEFLRLPGIVKNRRHIISRFIFMETKECIVKYCII